MQNPQNLAKPDPTRLSPLDIGSGELRQLGHQLVDRIAEFLHSLQQTPITPGESLSAARRALNTELRTTTMKEYR